MKRHTLLLATGLAALSLASLSAAEPAAGVPDPGFSIDKMDRTVDPRVDFAKFAAGGWYAKNEIPSDKSRWGGFNELAERTWAQVRAIVEESAAHPGAPGSVQQKVGDLFASATDTAAINALGLKPIQVELDAIASAKTLAELFGPAMRMQLGVGGPFFSPAFFADQKQSDSYGFYLFQGGMSLPSKEYYFSEKFA
ncbi:MAG: M13 family metallopeptidase N-terminal domain-containing protein, partial [Lacunisphaera sp.]|nr:M13 family metallopeptidase N-terminal domain-containing protein [Lacunisphaera sp.]